MFADNKSEPRCVIASWIAFNKLWSLVYWKSSSFYSTDDDSEVSQENTGDVAGRHYKPLKGVKQQHSTAKRILAQVILPNTVSLIIVIQRLCFWLLAIFQSLVTSAVMLSSASCGMPVGYSAILLPQLKSANDTMQIDDEIGSWIGMFIFVVDSKPVTICIILKWNGRTKKRIAIKLFMILTHLRV